METETIKQHKVFLKELKEKLGIQGKMRHIQISPIIYNKEGFLDDDKTLIIFKEVNN